MNWGRTSARSPSATYSINSTSYTYPVATSYSSHHTPSYSSHITSYSSRGNLYPYHGTNFSSNESIRTNNNGDNRIPQVLAFCLSLFVLSCTFGKLQISWLQVPRSRSVDPALVREASITRQLIETPKDHQRIAR